MQLAVDDRQELFVVYDRDDIARVRGR